MKRKKLTEKELKETPIKQTLNSNLPCEYSVLKNLGLNSVILKRIFFLNFLIMNFLTTENLSFQPYILMTPSPCPLNCETCSLTPTFHCVQCNPGFILSADQQSCNCPPNFNIVNGFCSSLHPGCSIMSVHPNQTIYCVQCDLTKKLQINGTQCQCFSGYQFDVNGNCQDICGDGRIITTECDDNNTQSGDGCSSTCKIQQGFKCNTNISPTLCDSLLALKYKIENQMDDLNSAQIILIPQNSHNLPFPIFKQQFQPVTDYISLRIIISEDPYKQLILDHQQLLEINQHNQIILSFQYNFTVEGLSAQIILNYEKTKYVNYTQIITFNMAGDNDPLKYTNYGTLYTWIGHILMAGTILSMVGLLLGLISPKFIGLQTILTFQIIFYSQLTVYDFKQWPPGFVQLKFLKLATGYNNFFTLTDFLLLNDEVKQLNILQIRKLFIENFNLNFVILALAFIALFVITAVRSKKQAEVKAEVKQMSKKASGGQPNIEHAIKQKLSQLRIYDKVNIIAFNVFNQLGFWLILPYMSGIGGEFKIANDRFIFINGHTQNDFLVDIRGVIMFFALFMILSIVYNSFKNMWLSLEIYNQQMERKEEMTYKRGLLVYLLIVGTLVFFFNDIKISFIYCSSILIVVHILYMCFIIALNPYRQSLRVHTLTLYINNIVVLIFLIVTNLINYIQNLNQTFILAFGFFMTGCCVILGLLTFLRLYYELRYGKGLEMKIMKEKQQEKLLQERMNYEKLANKATKPLNKNKLKLKTNIYHLECQLLEQNKKEYFQWIKSKAWDQKTKETLYFRKYQQKPLDWLKKNDVEKYDVKMNELQKFRRVQEQRKIVRQSNPQYQKITQKLKNEIKQMKSKKFANKNKKYSQLPLH